MIENIFRKLEHRSPYNPAPARRSRRPALPPKLQRNLDAGGEVDRGILFSVVITIAAFIPLFTMQGVVCHIFSPMAKATGDARLGALLATVPGCPMLPS